MKTLRGIAVSPGIAIGEAIIKQKKKISIENKYIENSDKDSEIERFNHAVMAETSELERFIENYTKTKEDKELLNTHKAILLDPLLSERIIAQIDKENFTVENALYNFLLEITNIFDKMSNDYLAERIADYEDVIIKLIDRLTGKKDKLFEEEFLKNQDKSYILVMDNISPSDVTKSYHSNVRGICLQKGSKTSHSAIIARALGLPVIVGISALFQNITDNTPLIIDGNKGIVIVDSDRQTLSNYLSQYRKEEEIRQELEDIVNLPCLTKDGKKISLMANIELEQEIDVVLSNNADGVGLFRTEFLFVNRDNQPTEEEQFQLYSTLAKKLGEKQLIIRTFDLGGDKISNLVHTPKEHNPYLGCRGIRLSLQYPDMFKRQVRAILRAGFYGNVAMMFPMISSVDDFIAAQEIVSQCKNELKINKIPYNNEIKIGIMIEVPSAVLCAEELAKRCDFFSIGTNDLVQYTLAADRNSEIVSKYYDSYHPAIFKLIAMTVNIAHRFGKNVSVCGELASEYDFICLLIALEVDSLSVNPNSLLAVKKAIMNCNFAETKKIIRKIFKLNRAEEVRELINSFSK
ncbi:MAG: phosphoenolpyruvate--protein phosphotransferase [Candidatus Cloacimonetes bacterium]|nr:phosphoenolpyruvate--protein phosphotransferase [Candidatus Cloacimonadota bacterium]